MNVLVIDDQPDVVNGILIGVHWKKLFVDNAYHAYNMNQAQKCFFNYKIDIMLCDIEMPMGSGIELLQWVKENYEDTKCIFLTAHAEFSYAQQAIKLGCFDYILQPARYEDIEKVLQSAIDEINRESKVNKYYDIMLKLNSDERDLINRSMREYLLFKLDAEKVLYITSKLGITLSLKTNCNLVLSQIIDSENYNTLIENLHFTEFRNVLGKLSDRDFNNTLLIPLENTYFAILFFGEKLYDVNEQQKMFNEYIMSCEASIKEKVACYISDKISFEYAPYQLKRLFNLSKDNVAEKQKVFMDKDFYKTDVYEYPDFKRWVDLINQGYSDIVQIEIHKYLKSQADMDRLNIKILTRFQQDFLQLFFDFLNRYRLTAHEVFEGKYDYNLIVQSCYSIEKMYHLVDYIMNYIKFKQGNIKNTESPIDEIINYVQHNLYNNISREDIAEDVHLNPQYISKLFKKEKGVNLSDYIIQEKMKIAESYVKNTNLTVTMIASKLGYTNFSYFTSCFKKSCGMSPSDYRRQIIDNRK